MALERRHKTKADEEAESPNIAAERAQDYFVGAPFTCGRSLLGDATVFHLNFGAKKYLPADGNQHWPTTVDGCKIVRQLLEDYCQIFAIFDLQTLLHDFVATHDNSWQDTIGTAERIKFMSFRRKRKVIERCILMTTDPGDLVLDPTCGSGTTAFVAEQWGRRWITIDTSRVAIALARTRLMAAKFPYYLLADSPEGIRKEVELSGDSPAEVGRASSDRPRIRHARRPESEPTSKGLYLQSSPARHAQIHRQQSRHQRRHEPRGD